MTYLIKFDENGRKGETYITDFFSEEQKEEFIKRGFIETSEEDFSLYVQPNGGSHGTGYIRGKDGKPTDAPPYIPAKSDVAKELYNNCAVDLRAIENEFLQALVVNDEELLEELREERIARIEQYKKDLEELEGRVWQE